MEPAILSLLPEAVGNAARVAQVKQLNERFENGDTEAAHEFFIDSVNAPGTWQSRPEPFRLIARENVWTISRQATDVESMGVAGAAQLKMPVLLIGGARSPTMFTEVLDALRKALPSDSRDIAECGAFRLQACWARGVYDIAMNPGYSWMMNSHVGFSHLLKTPPPVARRPQLP